MQIDIGEIRRSRKKKMQYSFVLAKDELDIQELSSDVEIDLELYLIENEIVVNGNFLVEIELICGKCLKKFSEKLEDEFSTVFLDDDFSEDYHEAEYNFDSKELVKEILVNEKIDVTKLISEYLVLSIPQYPICHNNCSFVEEYRYIEEEKIDPRWKKLLEMNINSKT